MIPITNFENYLVNEEGVVVNSVKGNTLTPSLNENGYLYICLWKNNKGYTKTLHRIVAKAYVPNPNNKPIVNHIDANRANPHKDNLEWVTQSENISHAYKLGTMAQKKKLTDLQLKECLFRFLSGDSMTHLSLEFECALSPLSINLRNTAVKQNKAAEFTAELIRQKRIRNTRSNINKKQPIQQITHDGHVVAIHESLSAASKALDKKTCGPISNALNGRQKQAYGFIWKYI